MFIALCSAVISDYLKLYLKFVVCAVTQITLQTFVKILKIKIIICYLLILLIIRFQDEAAVRYKYNGSNPTVFASSFGDFSKCY